MSFGYLVHDFIDLVVNERSARIIELLFHHVVVLTGFTVTHLTEKFLYIVVIGLLMEVNRFIRCFLEQFIFLDNNVLIEKCINHEYFKLCK